MKKFGPVLGVFSLLLLAPIADAQNTDLTGLTICIDPGHGGHNPANDRYVVPDPGIEFWESESNFQKALHLRSLLQAHGATVILTRETNDYPDELEPSLEARVALANANNVDWFHSIHSNATGLAVNTSINYTLMLVREMRPGGPYSGSGSGLGVPEQQPSLDISRNYMSPLLNSYLRTQSNTTFLDWTFYGGANGGFSLGVLRGLSMPGELSEGSMHDFYPETRRLMNNDYRKMEAYALLRSFLAQEQVPLDTVAIVAGIVTDVSTGKPLNGCRVRLLPENRLYSGDAMNNGFFMFDGVMAGPHTLRFETPFYVVDSVTISPGPGAVLFADRSSESFAAPLVLSSSPAANDTSFFPNGQITLSFSKPMDTASVRRAFSIAPAVPGKIIWGATSVFAFKPDTVLAMPQTYTVTIDTNARSAGGQPIDGNGDGTSGDPFVLTFRTMVADVFPPVLLAAHPAAGSTRPTPSALFSLTFNEPLNPSTVTITNIAVQQVGGSLQTRTLEYTEAGGRGGISVFLTNGVLPGGTYRLRVSNLADVKGNRISTSTPILFNVTIAPDQYVSPSILDSLDGTTAGWGHPDTTSGTVGVLSASFSSDSRKLSAVAGNLGSGKLTIAWDTLAATKFVRLPLSRAAGGAVHFRPRDGVVQAYVFGDGSGARVRFAVDDSIDAFPAGRSENREVSRWTPIDWVGWRLVEWNLTSDTLGSGTGNGALEGELRLAAIEVDTPPGQTVDSTTLLIDHVQVAHRLITGVEATPTAVPERFALEQNYPNPFNPTTNIRLTIVNSQLTIVKVFDVLGCEVATLLNEMKDPGTYTVRFDGARLAGGVYICRMTAGAFVASRKMILMR